MKLIESRLNRLTILANSGIKVKFRKWKGSFFPIFIERFNGQKNLKSFSKISKLDSDQEKYEFFHQAEAYVFGADLKNFKKNFPNPEILESGHPKSV